MTSRVYPHAAFAEDQAYGQTILTVHVLHRGFTAGAIVGTGIGASMYGWRAWRASRAATSQAGVPLSAISVGAPRLSTSLVKGAGRGTIIGTVLLSGALFSKMRGREEIEWQDRSWRLLSNEGQVLVDDFSVAGAAAGIVLGGVRATGGQLGLTGVLGRAGLGSMVGTVAYLGWQYGMKGMLNVGTEEVKREGKVVVETAEAAKDSVKKA